MKTFKPWIILLVVALLTAGTHECHVRNWNLAANLLVAVTIFLFGIFIWEIVLRATEAAIRKVQQRGPEKEPQRMIEKKACG